MIRSTTRVFRSQSTVWREVDGQVAIISIDVSRVRLLSEVGGHIWKRCDNESVDALVRSVCEEYDVDAQTAHKDVAEFLEDLSRRGMVRFEAAE